MKSKLIFGVLSAAILFSVASAGIRGPGKYCGAVIYDRWGDCMLYSGAYVMYISEAVKDRLRGHAGRSVKIDARNVYQPINPGDGLITEFMYLGPAPLAKDLAPLEGLSLRATPAFADGERPSIMLSIANTGGRSVEAFSSELAPTLLVNKVGHQSIWAASDGPSYAVVTRQTFVSGPDYKPRISGEGVENGRRYTWGIDAALPVKLVLKPQREHVIAVSFELPQGEYDFLAGYGGGVHAGKGLASNLVAFDVDQKGKAYLVQVKGR